MTVNNPTPELRRRNGALRVGGFTLVELVVSIAILAVLAAFAIPRMTSLDQQARISTVNSLAGVLKATSVTVRALCMTSVGCDANANSWRGSIAGKGYWLNYGYPDAGDTLGAGGGQIDDLLDYSGFTASLPNPLSTLFVRSDAPDPPNCSVQYFDAYHSPPTPHLVVLTTGC